MYSSAMQCLTWEFDTTLGTDNSMAHKRWLSCGLTCNGERTTLTRLLSVGKILMENFTFLQYFQPDLGIFGRFWQHLSLLLHPGRNSQKLWSPTPNRPRLRFRLLSVPIAIHGHCLFYFYYSCLGPGAVLGRGKAHWVPQCDSGDQSLAESHSLHCSGHRYFHHFYHSQVLWDRCRRLGEKGPIVSETSCLTNEQFILIKLTLSNNIFVLLLVEKEN